MKPVSVHPGPLHTLGVSARGVREGVTISNDPRSKKYNFDRIAGVIFKCFFKSLQKYQDDT